MLSHGNSLAKINLANENLQKVNQIIMQLRASKQLASKTLQLHVIELLLNSITLLASHDEVLRMHAIQQLYRLVMNGDWGFTKNPQIMRQVLKEEKFYKIEAALSTIDNIFSQPENTIVSLLKKQGILRILIDNAVGYGNQAANLNLISKLRKLEYKGRIDLIYPKHAREKLENMLALSSGKLHKKPNYFHKGLNIYFIELNQFLLHRQQNKNLPLALGLTGALDSNSPEDYLKLNSHSENLASSSDNLQNNFANFLNVKTFVKFSPYLTHASADTVIYQKNLSLPIIQANSRNKALNVPVADIQQMKMYLDTNAKGQKFLSKHPGFKQLIAAIETQEINYFSVYGRSIKENPANLLTFGLAARHAQLHGPEDFRRPVIMMIFHSANQELLDYLAEINNFNISVLSSIDDLLKVQLKKNHVYLLFSDPLPKILFEALFTLETKNIWPPVREGASTLTALSTTTGKPHIYCKFNQQWEILDAANTSLKPHLELIATRACQKSSYAPNSETIALIGNYIIAAQQEGGELTTFFTSLKKEATNPENDRILIGLTAAAKLTHLTPTQIEKILTLHLYRGFYIDSIKAAKISYLPEEKIEPPSKYTPTLFSTLLNSASSTITKVLLHAGKELQSCQTYFPCDQPNLWNGSSLDCSLPYLNLSKLDTRQSTLKINN